MIETILTAAVLTIQTVFGGATATTTSGSTITASQTNIIAVTDTLEMN